MSLLDDITFKCGTWNLTQFTEHQGSPPPMTPLGLLVIIAAAGEDSPSKHGPIFQEGECLLISSFGDCSICERLMAWTIGVRDEQRREPGGEYHSLSCFRDRSPTPVVCSGTCSGPCNCVPFFMSPSPSFFSPYSLNHFLDKWPVSKYLSEVLLSEKR